MTGMRANKFVILITLICINCLGVNLLSIVVFAQMPNMTVQPGVSIPAHLTQGSVPTAYVTGYVFDEAGNPVPSAIVTLRQDGNLWQAGKFIYGDGANPVTTSIHSPAKSGVLTEGSFAFGHLFPGESICSDCRVRYAGKKATLPDFGPQRDAGKAI